MKTPDMPPNEKYEPIIVDLQQSRAIRRSPKMYVVMAALTIAVLSILGAVLTAFYYYLPKPPDNGGLVAVDTPRAVVTPTVAPSPTIVAATTQPQPTPRPTTTPQPQPTTAVVKATGYLNLDSHPDNAEVVIDSKVLGRTPLHKYALPAGTYTLTFKHQGQTSAHTLTIEAGETTDYTHTFPGFGSLKIRATRSGSEVYINGEFAGYTPLTVKGLAPGAYDIEVRRRGYATVERTVTLAKAEQREVLITIKRLEYISDQPRDPTPTPAEPQHPSDRLND